jgi:Uma2 family endonuclease
MNALKPMEKHDSPYTYRDYARWPETEKCELAGGEAFAMSPAPGWNHQEIVGKIYMDFSLWFRDYPYNVFISPVDVFIPKPGQGQSDADGVDTILQPDLGVLCDRSKIMSRGVWGAPDLVLEAMSPSSILWDMIKKRAIYEAAGVKEYWLLEPRAEYGIIFVREPSGLFDQGTSYNEQNPRMASRLFPGLTLDLVDLRKRLATV